MVLNVGIEAFWYTNDFKDISIIGDDDYNDADLNDSDGKADDDRPECEYGVDCYRKNPQHKNDFKHTHKAQPKRKVRNKSCSHMSAFQKFACFPVKAVMYIT